MPWLRSSPSKSDKNCTVQFVWNCGGKKIKKLGLEIIDFLQ